MLPRVLVVPVEPCAGVELSLATPWVLCIAGALYHVKDTHTHRYLDGCAPDITILLVGRDVSSFNAIMLVELQVSNYHWAPLSLQAHVSLIPC